MDLFVVGVSGNIYHRGWNGSAWTGWAQVLGGVAAAGSRVAVSARRSNIIDIFAISKNRNVVTATKWDGGSWSGWQNVAGGVAGSAGQLTVTSRGLDKLDVFVVGGDGGVWTAVWDLAVSPDWRGWWRLP